MSITSCRNAKVGLSPSHAGSRSKEWNKKTPHFNFTVKISRQDLDSAISLWIERCCALKKKNLETQSVFFKGEVFSKDEGKREIAVSPPTPN